MVPSRSGNDNLFALCPIDSLLERDNTGAHVCSGIEHGPCHTPFLAMDIKCALMATDEFVSEIGQLGLQDVTM